MKIKGPYSLEYTDDLITDILIEYVKHALVTEGFSQERINLYLHEVVDRDYNAVRHISIEALDEVNEKIAQENDL